MSRYVPLAAASLALMLGGCELGEKVSQQTGYRGTGVAQIYDVDTYGEGDLVPDPPYALPPEGGPLAVETYENVQVLTDMNTEQFNHLMAAITEWVSPEQGCAYCHNPANMADDSVYTKDVARRMLQMTRALNGEWDSHTGQTGVTCYTCHRGQPVPTAVWAMNPVGNPQSVRNQRRGQNAPNPNVGYSSLPSDIFNRYFSGNPSVVRVASASAYPSAQNTASTMAAEDSYGVMMHLSQALGINCTYCHNSQSFQAWTQSSAQRATAWYGIQMVRDINEDYITPLAPIFPANRKGPLGDPYKANCLTCHQGQAKPLNGQSMIADYPYLHPPGVAAISVQSPADAIISEVLAEPEEMTDESGVPVPPNTQ